MSPDTKLVPPDVARAYADQLRVELGKLAESAEQIASMARLVQINATAMLQDLSQHQPDTRCHAAK